MSREREKIPWPLWLGFLAAALVAHALMIAPGGAALGHWLRSSAPERGGDERVMDFELVDATPRSIVLGEAAAQGEQREDLDRWSEADVDVDRERAAEPAARTPPPGAAPAAPGGAPQQAASAEQQEASQPATQPAHAQVEVEVEEKLARADAEARGEASAPAKIAVAAEPGAAAIAQAEDGQLAPASALALPQSATSATPATSTTPTTPPTQSLASLAGSPKTLQGAFGAPPSRPVLAEVERGQETMLDSKAHRYASFYKRVREQLLAELRLREAHDEVDPQHGEYGEDPRRTAVLIRLDAKGELLEVFVERGSGAMHLDAEVVRAVRAAAPFPNPPKGLLRGGRVELRFGVTLDFEAGRALVDRF
ncbi:TonB family protein [Pseudenhygromyxa sp. WMMC2535]|uniref:TonB family protein n=1 Tax=Pseudenhygromyxa sp. WMMC2535 TaxID=2712867 RepID=UPI001554BE32|nr:TonB family protein [Pseudenhygromyxa sp. WMMC2535]NVB41248.1 TonB family protein [Pseudenhygromyxa sp. WMMC2535]